MTVARTKLCFNTLSCTVSKLGGCFWWLSSPHFSVDACGTLLYSSTKLKKSLKMGWLHKKQLSITNSRWTRCPLLERLLSPGTTQWPPLQLLAMVTFIPSPTLRYLWRSATCSAVSFSSPISWVLLLKSSTTSRKKWVLKTKHRGWETGSPYCQGSPTRSLYPGLYTTKSLSTSTTFGLMTVLLRFTSTVTL